MILKTFFESKKRLPPWIHELLFRKKFECPKRAKNSNFVYFHGFNVTPKELLSIILPRKFKFLISVEIDILARKFRFFAMNWGRSFWKFKFSISFTRYFSSKFKFLWWILSEIFGAKIQIILNKIMNYWNSTKLTKQTDR